MHGSFFYYYYCSFGYNTQEYVGQAHTTCSALVNRPQASWIYSPFLYQFVFLPACFPSFCQGSIVGIITQNLSGFQLLWERRAIEAPQIFC